MIAVSTFSGCGGSSLGLKMAGWTIPVAYEFMPKAASSYRANAPDTVVVEKDIRQVTGEEVNAMAGVKHGELDLLEGSPPCAAFSMTGKREKGWGEEKKYSKTVQRVDDLFFEFLRVMREANPRAVMMENVAGMAMGNAKTYLNAVIRELREAGYGRVDVRVYCSSHYGVPQFRKRIVFVALRDDVVGEYTPPEPSGRLVDLREGLEGVPLPTCTEEQAKFLSGDKMGAFLYRATVPGSSLSHASLARRGVEGGFNHFRLSWDRPTPTVLQAGCWLYHPDIARCLTVPEMRRICGFPDSFALTGSRNDRYERLGRSVTPPLYEAIGKKVLEALSE